MNQNFLFFFNHSLSQKSKQAKKNFTQLFPFLLLKTKNVIKIIMRPKSKKYENILLTALTSFILSLSVPHPLIHFPASFVKCIA